MPAYYLRQSATVAGTIPAGTPWGLYLTLPQGILGTPNTRLVLVQCVSGLSSGGNTAVVNGKSFPIDVGLADGTNHFSTDISIYNEQAGDAGVTVVLSSLTGAPNGTNYMAAWVGEYVNIDQSNYGYSGNPPDSNGNVDYGASFDGSGTGSSVPCIRTGGDTVNYPPELGVWAAGGKGSVGVTGQTYDLRGYVTDGANIWLAVQDKYFNAIGVFNPSFNLNGSSYYNWANLQMKTTSFPPQGGPTPGNRAQQLLIPAKLG
jgi:hypothetical protein